MLAWQKNYGLLIMGQVFIFIILGQIGEALKPFALIKDHVLLPQASMLQEGCFIQDDFNARNVAVSS
jgi:hypothetical protein